MVIRNSIKSIKDLKPLSTLCQKVTVATSYQMSVHLKGLSGLLLHLSFTELTKKYSIREKKIKAVPETNLADMILSLEMIWDYTTERQKEESGSQSIPWDTI